MCFDIASRRAGFLRRSQRPLALVPVETPVPYHRLYLGRVYPYQLFRGAAKGGRRVLTHLLRIHGLNGAGDGVGLERGGAPQHERAQRDLAERPEVSLEVASIEALADRGVDPYAVDRRLAHLLQRVRAHGEVGQARPGRTRDFPLVEHLEGVVSVRRRRDGAGHLEDGADFLREEIANLEGRIPLGEFKDGAAIPMRVGGGLGRVLRRPAQGVLVLFGEEMQPAPREYREVESLEGRIADPPRDLGAGGTHDDIGGERPEQGPAAGHVAPPLHVAGEVLQVSAVPEEGDGVPPGEDEDEAGPPRDPEDGRARDLPVLEVNPARRADDRDLRAHLLAREVDVESIRLRIACRTPVHALARADITRRVSRSEGRASSAPARRRSSTEKRPVATPSTDRPDPRAHSMSCGVSPMIQVWPGP